MTFCTKETIGNSERTLNHTRLYSREWDKSNKNSIGPGPAAYSALYDDGSAKMNRKGATFAKAMRKLTNGEKGPGPSSYTTTGGPDVQTHNVPPKPKFNKAHRNIDVIKFEGKNDKINRRGI